MVQVGQVASVKRIFSQQDFDRFAVLSGDDNPIHVDPEFAAGTRFGRTVAHGMLLYSTVSALLGSQLPGPGTVQLEQELMFPNATPAGEEVTIRLEVTGTNPAEGTADLTTVITRPDGSVGLQGRTLIRLPNIQYPDTQYPSIQIPQPSQHPGGSFKGLEIGQRAETRRTYSMRDMDEYADLTGDTNPTYNGDYARRAGCDGPTIPGGLLAGLFSYLLGTQLPGSGTNYLKQRLEFRRPAHPDQELTAAVEIIRLRPDKQLVNLSTVCANPAGQVACYGEALVLAKDVSSEV